MSLKRLFNVVIAFVVILLVLFFIFASFQIYKNTNSTPNAKLINEIPLSESGSQITGEINTNNWDTYLNYDYKYLFRYPRGLKIENIKLQQFIIDSEKYNGIHSDNICSRIEYGSAWLEIFINPKDPALSKFCGKYEYKSDQEISRRQLQIAGESITIQTIEDYTYDNNSPAELHFFTLEKGEIELKIEYGKTVDKKQADTDNYNADKQVIEKIIMSIELI
ncbi:hypothetical protein KBD45_03240 [Candidatus Dojkabacteria bacterium]|nr:hypothetical protein [Candidatus Dojkabacteria bacterium]